MSLLKLASLHTVARFCFTTDATRSLVVVFPFEPPMAVIGNPKSFRYSAASRPNALRVSATATTAQPRCEVRSARAGLPGNPAFSFLPSPFSLPTSTTTATAPFRAASSRKLCPSKCSPRSAKNKSPACACRESVHTRRTGVCPAPLNNSPPHAVAINFNERVSIHTFHHRCHLVGQASRLPPQSSRLPPQASRPRCSLQWPHSASLPDGTPTPLPEPSPCRHPSPRAQQPSESRFPPHGHHSPQHPLGYRPFAIGYPLPTERGRPRPQQVPTLNAARFRSGPP